MSSRAAKSPFDSRSTMVAVFLLLMFGVVIARLFDLQVIKGAALKKQAEAQHNIYQQLLPSRGEIDLVDKTSSTLIPLATNQKSYLVYAVPPDITNPNLTAAGLAGILGMAQSDILSKISAPGKKYVIIQKQLTDQQQAAIKNLALPGIFFDSEDTRVYPQNSLLSQTVGFLGYKGSNPDRTGLYGLERYFNTSLAGTAGNIEGQKSNGGGYLYGADMVQQPAIDGVNLLLTVDQTIQFQAESVLKDAVTKNGANSGSVIVADPKTGAILALANYPDFNPNQYNTVTDPGVFNNEAVTGNYEPGSTFKGVTMAAAIDAGKVTATSTYTDTGSVQIDNFTIKNALPGARGVQTMTQVIDYSLNTGAIYAENQLGNQDFLKYVKAFGFGQATGIELPETVGNLSGLDGNIQVNYDTASFGQGITVTPIQMVEAYIALANGGKMMRPYLVQSVIHADGRTVNTQPTEVGQPVSAATAAEITGMLVDDVENGEGKKAGVPGYFVAGKTGTAQVAGPDGKYIANDNIGSFLGYAPASDPQFVMLLRIDNPRDVSFAESTAAPAWGQLAQFILNYMRIPPTRTIPEGK